MSIITDIAVKNPKHIDMCCRIMGILIPKIDSSQHENICSKIFNKLMAVPDSSFTQIWMQRMFLKVNVSFSKNFTESLCLLVDNGHNNSEIWDITWVTDKKIKKDFDKTSIIDSNKLNSISQYIQEKEVNIFIY